MAVASHICIYSLQNLKEVEKDVHLCRCSPTGLSERNEHNSDL